MSAAAEALTAGTGSSVVVDQCQICGNEKLEDILFLGYLQSVLTPSLPQEIESSIKPAIDGLTSSLRSKFMIVLVAGVVLMIVGYALSLYLSRKFKH